jgi:hypothetical protein
VVLRAKIEEFTWLFIGVFLFPYDISVVIVLLSLNQVDLAYVIINKLVPAGLSHLDDYLGALRLSSRQRVPLDKAALQYLGPSLHPAARNRDNELSYLRQLTTLLLPQLLPSSQLHCK